jgi:dTDP-4-dehydrorhamnose 3,5-epimerase
MKLIPSPLQDVLIIEPDVFADDRGWFTESFNAPRLDAALKALGLPAAPPFVQDNHSCSRAGVLRGLHYQLPPHAQGKLVRVVQGRVWDVTVDIRRSSPHFGCWAGIELSAANRRQLWIPPGFAHGFLALAAGQPVQLAAKDAAAPLFADAEVFEQRPADRAPAAALAVQGRRRLSRVTRTAELLHV